MSPPFRSRFVSLLGNALLGFAASATHAGEPLCYLDIPAEPGLVDQHTHSPKSCGPASLLNALKFGSPAHRQAYHSLHGEEDGARLHHLTDRYFLRPSTHLAGVPRFTRHGGCSRRDLAAAAREVASEFHLPALRHGEWRREPKESAASFVERVHRDPRKSLRWETPPVVEFRSQLAHWDEEAEDWKWQSLADHYVVVTHVPESLRDGALGFPFDYIDPNGGLLASGFSPRASCTRNCAIPSPRSPGKQPGDGGWEEAVSFL